MRRTQNHTTADARTQAPGGQSGEHEDGEVGNRPGRPEELPDWVFRLWASGNEWNTQAEVLRQILPVVRDLRRSGSPALDLCSVAAGMLDGFFECGLGRWDIAAGAAIAEAAGATVIELQSSILPNPLLVVANPELLQALIKVLKESGAAIN